MRHSPPPSRARRLREGRHHVAAHTARATGMIRVLIGRLAGDKNQGTGPLAIVGEKIPALDLVKVAASLSSQHQTGSGQGSMLRNVVDDAA